MSEENSEIGLKVTGVLRKFSAKSDGSEWTEEEIESGLADEYLFEVISFEDGTITETWRRES